MVGCRGSCFSVASTAGARGCRVGRQFCRIGMHPFSGARFGMPATQRTSWRVTCKPPCRWAREHQQVTGRGHRWCAAAGIPYGESSVSWRRCWPRRPRRWPSSPTSKSRPSAWTAAIRRRFRRGRRLRRRRPVRSRAFSCPTTTSSGRCLLTNASRASTRTTGGSSSEAPPTSWPKGGVAVSMRPSLLSGAGSASGASGSPAAATGFK